MGLEYIFTLIKSVTKENFQMIKRRDLAYIIGMMDVNMKAGGTAVSNMAWGHIQSLKQ